MPDLRYSGFAPGFFRSSVRLAAGGDFLHALDIAVGIKAGDFDDVPLFVVVVLFAAGFAVAPGDVVFQCAVLAVVLDGTVYFAVLVGHDAFDGAVRVVVGDFPHLAVVVVGDAFEGAVGIGFSHGTVKVSGGVGAE